MHRFSPQGRAILNALEALGFDGVGDVRQGKLFDIALEAPDRAAAQDRLRDMCERLLANSVIEDYQVELT